MIKKLIVWYKKECKILFLCLVIGFIVTVSFGIFTKTYSYNMVQGISNQVIRFHVKANSNTEKDQKLKLDVRDAVLNEFAEGLNNSNNINETRQYLKDNLKNIELTASKVIKESGYDYNVKAYFTNEFFPTRTYANISLPTGSYEALRVDIGSSQGDNWWCVMFPPLCFVDVTTTQITQNQTKQLQNILTESQYNLVSNQNTGNNPQVQVKFKIVEWWQNKDKDNLTYVKG